MEWRKRPGRQTRTDLFMGLVFLGSVRSDAWDGKFWAQYSNGRSGRLMEHDSEESAKAAVEKWAAEQLATVMPPAQAEPPRCGNCRFWVHGVSGSGECRIDPAKLLVLINRHQESVIETHWPELSESEVGCGKHEPRRP